MVCWFAGVFYLVRLLIYFKESEGRNVEEKKILQPQYLLMINRLFKYITWPSTILTIVFGFSMIYLNPILLKNNWMISKLFFVLLLVAYTCSIYIFYNNAKNGRLLLSESFLRLWNELATVFLFVIVFLAILKNSVSWLFLLSLIVTVIAVLFFLVKLYRLIVLKKNKL
mgnify:CR=1 FL=1